jgi:hypothetical protein
MTKARTSVRKSAALLFLSLSFCYLSLAPGTVGGRGYITEEMDSGSRMLEIFNAWVKGRAIPPMQWSRHGPVPVLMDLPFIKAGKFFVSPDFVLSLQSSLLTAALVTLLYLWLRRLCSPGMSMLWSLTAAFGTMLWPYAYIGLETKQSLFVLLAGYLALTNGQIRSWPKLIGFALVCGLALTLKSTGIVMWPAVAYLVFVQFRDRMRSHLAQLLVVSVVIVGIVALGSWTRNFYWAPLGGGASNLLPWVIRSPLQLFTNAIGLLGSPTKGLLIYAPILIASLCALPRAFRDHRHIAVFASLVTICMGGFMSLLVVGADEVWGSRFMHVAIAPLILCIGAAWPRFEWRKHTPVIVLSTVGILISFLGAFYYYGQINFVQAKAGQNTMEWLYGDPVWNEVTFDARLFQVWMQSGDAPAFWTPAHQWVWTPPPGAPPWVAINLREYCKPQAFLIQFWEVAKEGSILSAFRLLMFSMIAGPLLLILTVFTSSAAPGSESSMFRRAP